MNIVERELFQELESRRFRAAHAKYEIELLLEIYNSRNEEKHYNRETQSTERKTVTYCCDDDDDCRQEIFNELISLELVEGSNVYTYDSGGLQYYFLTEKGDNLVERYLLDERRNKRKNKRSK